MPLFVCVSFTLPDNRVLHSLANPLKGGYRRTKGNSTAKYDEDVLDHLTEGEHHYEKQSATVRER
jgi:hypothetical protein